MKKLIISILLIFLSNHAGAGKVSYESSKDQENFKSLLKEFSVPFRTVYEYDREWVIWPDEYNNKAEIISDYGGDSLSTSRVELLFKLGLKDEGLSLLKKLATEGDPEAQHMLALEYVIDRNIERNYKKAKAWYEKSIESGNFYSYSGLAVLYEHGWGIDKNEKMALKLYKQAAKHDEASAICKIGHFYRDGKAGLQVNMEEAEKYYTKVKETNRFGYDCTAIP